MPVLVATLASALVAPSACSEVIYIGTGTGSGNLPLNTSYNDVRMQVIYLASEVGIAKEISGLALDVTAIPGQTLNNFTLRLKHTSLSSYSVRSWESTGWQVCYQANPTVLDTGWVQFDFTTPFYYDGVSNLMVDFSFNNNLYSTDGLCRYSVASPARSVYNRAYYGYGDNPLAWSGAANPTPLSSSSVPNIRLTTQDAPPAATPTLNPSSGTYIQATPVVVTCSTTDAAIHYTTNGDEPTQSDPIIASGGSITVSQSMTLKARAFAPFRPASEIATADYVLVTANPSFSPFGGTYSLPQQVTVTCATPGAIIRYTTNGSDPTASDPAIASGDTVPVPVSPLTVFKARAWHSELPPSQVTSAEYIFAAGAPSFTPYPGKYEQAQQVTLTSATPGAIIYYTTNGNVPTTSDPSVPSGGTITVEVSPATTLRARALAPSMNLSSIVTGVYRSPEILYVASDGNDTNNGTSWGAAKKTITAAISASAAGDEIWVKAGTYQEYNGLYQDNIVLKEGVRLLGGFAGTESASSQRNWFTNKTIITGYEALYVVTVPTGTTSRCVLDGFIIDGQMSGSIGVYCYDTTAIIRNNVIKNHTRHGIRCGFASPTIINNVISSNMDGGIYCHESHPKIINNTIVNNVGYDGGGVYLSFSHADITNNIIAYNSATHRGGAIAYFTDGSGIFGSATLANNCYYMNGIQPFGNGATPSSSDISMDPRFVSPATNDFRINHTSPCVNAGDNSVVQHGWLDWEGQPRQNGIVDIGVDEYWANQFTSTSGSKALANALPVRIDNGVVTAVFGEVFYIEAANRSAGIMVQKSDHGLTAGQVVIIQGTVETSPDEERFIAAKLITPTGVTNLAPLSFNNRTLGGESWLLSPKGGQKGAKDSVGLNNIGLLIKTTGKVTSVDSASGIFYMDDGSGRMDGSGAVGIRAKAGSLSLPTAGQIVTVTGISSCYKIGNDLYPLIKLTAAPVTRD